MNRILIIMLWLLVGTSVIKAQDMEPEDTVSRYSVQIDIRNAYISGVCIMRREPQQVTASIVNEFGVSALTYRYDRAKQKVKILSIMKKMDRWYVKRMLRKDLKVVMQQLLNGDEATEDRSVTYENKKYKIKYNYTPLTNEVKE